MINVLWGVAKRSLLRLPDCPVVPLVRRAPFAWGVKRPRFDLFEHFRQRDKYASKIPGQLRVYVACSVERSQLGYVAV